MMNVSTDTLNQYLQGWNLSNPTYIDVASACSDVYKVTMQDGEEAVLKIRYGRGVEAERFGAAALDYFDGDGIVKLYNSDDRAHLLEYIDGEMLRTVVDNGHDGKATEVICDIIAKLHTERKKPTPDLNSLKNHCAELFTQAAKSNASEVLKQAAQIGEELLNNQTNVMPLHGDVHHENILKSTRGWILIDPNGLIGDPVYEFANIFNNPINDRARTSDPERIGMLADIISNKMGYDRNKILRYAAMHMALSASWNLSADMKKKVQQKLENCQAVLRLVM